MANSPYSFKADTEALRGLCNRRLADMKAERLPHETLWKSLCANFEPDIGLALDGQAPSARTPDDGTGEILNSEPRILAQRLSAGLQSGITNQAQRWFLLMTPDPAAAQRSSAKRWLEDVTGITSAAMARSNLYTALDRTYLHEGVIGTACGVIVRGDAPGEAHVETSDAGDYWIAQNRRGRVDTLIRRIWMTPSKMVEEFGEGWLDADTIARAKGEKSGAQNEVEVYNLICPRGGRDEFSDIPESRPFASVYWRADRNIDRDGVLAVRSFGYNPIIAPRFAVNGSVYGYGPGKIALGDARELQTLERDKMRIIAENGTPTLAAPASLRGNTILDSYPGGMVWTPNDERTGDGGRIGRLFDSRSSPADIDTAQRSIEARIGRIFYADLFAMLLSMSAATPQMTARQVSELSAEKIALLGPVLTRMNTDLLDPLVTAFYSLLAEDGAFPAPPPELEGQPIMVRYVSALHIEQVSATKMRGISKVIDIVASVAQIIPSAVDKFDADQTIDEACEAIPESAAVIRDDKDVEDLRAKRAEAQQAAAAAEAAAKALPGIGAGVRDLANAPVGNASALDAAIGATGGLRR